MKRLFFILMTMAVLGSPLHAGKTIQNPDNNTTIELSTTEKDKKTSEERSLCIVQAFFNTVSSAVEIDTFGCGNSIAYLYNSAGTLVSSTTISIEDGFGTLSVPETSGLYYIVINSDRCYSQGYFVKE